MTLDSPAPHLLSATSPAQSRGYRFAPHAIAVLAVACTWPLLFVGGLVTTYRVGMAVPDWPTTFGINMFVYDMREAAFGVLVEHGHRLYGAAVGVCTILLMLDFLAFDRRKSVKALGAVALLLVIAQGVLGGLRVNHNSTLLAMIHGCTGQAFFAFMMILATITARSWFVERRPVEGVAAVQILSIAMLAVAYLQIILGAWLRHFTSIGALMSHATFSLTVVSLVVGLAWAVHRRKAELPGLLGPIRAMELTLAIQVSLGIAAWWVLRPFDGTPHSVTTAQALIRTGHQANAALLLGSAVVLALRVFGRAAGVPFKTRMKPLVSSSTLGLEVVA